MRQATTLHSLDGILQCVTGGPANAIKHSWPDPTTSNPIIPAVECWAKGHVSFVLKQETNVFSWKRRGITTEDEDVLVTCQKTSFQRRIKPHTEIAFLLDCP